MTAVGLNGHDDRLDQRQLSDVRQKCLDRMETSEFDPKASILSRCPDVLVRNPLDVLLASENGVGNVVSFFGTIPSSCFKCRPLNPRGLFFALNLR